MSKFDANHPCAGMAFFLRFGLRLIHKSTSSSLSSERCRLSSSSSSLSVLLPTHFLCLLGFTAAFCAFLAAACCFFSSLIFFFSAFASLRFFLSSRSRSISSCFFVSNSIALSDDSALESGSVHSFSESPWFLLAS